MEPLYLFLNLQLEAFVEEIEVFSNSKLEQIIFVLRFTIAKKDAVPFGRSVGWERELIKAFLMIC